MKKFSLKKVAFVATFAGVSFLAAKMIFNKSRVGGISDIKESNFIPGRFSHDVDKDCKKKTLVLTNNNMNSVSDEAFVK